MNYSRSMKQKQNKFVKRIVISWAIVFMLGLVLGIISGVLIGKATQKEVDETEPTIFFTDEVQEAEFEEVRTYEKPEIAEPTLLGKYRITSYCSCEKCCGSWAKDRPGGIVKGAAGIELTPGVSVASSLPFGTELYIAGYGEVIVQDRTASWVVEKYNGEIIDIYFNDHEEALNFGVKYANVYQFESED